jgi:hypothetical protein
MGDLGRIVNKARSGAEPFHDASQDLGFDLLSFWRWSASDIVSNATRGILAEYLVARAVGAAKGVREEWAAYDLLCPDGTTIEVKSAAPRLVEASKRSVDNRWGPCGHSTVGRCGRSHWVRCHIGRADLNDSDCIVFTSVFAPHPGAARGAARL